MRSPSQLWLFRSSSWCRPCSRSLAGAGFGVETAVEQGRSPAWAALVVGAVFLGLHIPLYLPGHLYAGLPYWPLPVILLTSSALLTWVYLRTRSVLVTALMHAAFNATVPLTWGLDAEWVWQSRAVVLVAITAVVVGGVGLPWWLSPLNESASSKVGHDVEPPSTSRSGPGSPLTMSTRNAAEPRLV